MTVPMREEATGIPNPVTFPSLQHVMGTDWREYARCAKESKDVFFDYIWLNKRKERRDRVNNAVSMCLACPVRTKCYEFAVLNNEPHGIWAGTLPDERRELYKDFKKTGILKPL